MKSFTIHKIDQALYSRLRELAEKEGTSLNRLVKRILRTSLGLEPPVKNTIDLSEIAGIWSDEEAVAFNESIDLFDQVSLMETDAPDKS